MLMEFAIFECKRNGVNVRMYLILPRLTCVTCGFPQNTSTTFASSLILLAGGGACSEDDKEKAIKQVLNNQPKGRRGPVRRKKSFRQSLQA